MKQLFEDKDTQLQYQLYSILDILKQKFQILEDKVKLYKNMASVNINIEVRQTTVLHTLTLYLKNIDENLYTLSLGILDSKNDDIKWFFLPNISKASLAPVLEVLVKEY